MASGWLHGEARRVMADARSIAVAYWGQRIYLHFRRGRLEATRARELAGHELVTCLPLPLGKDDESLLEWMLHELRSVPCHP